MLSAGRDAFLPLVILGGMWITGASAAEPRSVRLQGNEYAVIEADSPAASRLDTQYPSRLRRIEKKASATQLNNVAVLFSKVGIAAAGVATSMPLLAVPPATKCTSADEQQSPSASVIQVCVDDRNTVAERDSRALRAFVDFSKRESRALAAHVSSEREWTALERALGLTMRDAKVSIPFREVRYGDGLPPGQIKIQRLGTN